MILTTFDYALYTSICLGIFVVLILAYMKIISPSLKNPDKDRHNSQ